MFHRKVHPPNLFQTFISFKRSLLRGLMISEEGHLIHQPDKKLYRISVVPSGVPNHDTPKSLRSCGT